MAASLAQIITRTADIHGNGDAEVLGLDASKTAEELSKARHRMRAIAARWQRDPARTLGELRAFFTDPALTAADAKAWIDTWVFALEHPQDFERAIAADDGPSALEGPGALGLGASRWFRELRGYLHLPPAISREERVVCDRLLAGHGWPSVAELKASGIELNPHIRQFEKLDPWWIGVADENLLSKLGRWPNLEKFVAHSKASPFVYEATAEEATRPIGLFADFGTGLYHSRMMARQFERAALGHAIHLGDVYYAGRQQELARYLVEPLRPIAQRTKIFALAENHELYSGGKWYLDFLRDPAKSGISPQQGSYFCLRFPHHQLIGIDVNWHKRQRFLHEPLRVWLAERLAEADGRTTLLLSGSGPYGYGSASAYRLLSDLWDWLRDGRIAMWIWGDDHYCALFDRDDLVAPFYGTCIGHGGYPSGKQSLGQASWAKPLWVEDEPRFPAWTGLRQDMMNNGWSSLRLGPGGSFSLTYLDWLGAKRCHAAFAVTQGRCTLDGLTTFPRQGSADQVPPLP